MPSVMFFCAEKCIENWGTVGRVPCVGEMVVLKDKEYRVREICHTSPDCIDADVGEIADLGTLAPVPDESRPLLK